MTPTEILQQTLAPFKIEVGEDLQQQFLEYASFLVEYNENVNLTAITDPIEIAVKHFADSIIPLALTEIPQGASLIDVGTGAGFPGVPMKMIRNDIELTLLDSLNKRLVFLEQLSTKLGQKNSFVHARAEIAGADKALRENFDYATSRAVAQLAVLCEYCLPFVKVGGSFIALKGPDCQEEITAAEKAIKILGGKIAQVTPYNLGEAGGRTLIVIEKQMKTPPKYPRQRVKLSQKPL